MDSCQKRRDFLGMTLGGVTAIGGIFALKAIRQTWDPLPSVASAGFVTVDISSIQEGEMRTIQWRGKPVFILRKSAAIAKNTKRDILIGDKIFTVVIGLCTHLGCIPYWSAGTNQFKCACHGGEFDASGINTFGPPPRPLDIPPFKLNGESIVFGEEGVEYKKIIQQA